MCLSDTDLEQRAYPGSSSNHWWRLLSVGGTWEVALMIKLIRLAPHILLPDPPLVQTLSRCPPDYFLLKVYFFNYQFPPFFFLWWYFGQATSGLAQASNSILGIYYYVCISESRGCFLHSPFTPCHKCWWVVTHSSGHIQESCQESYIWILPNSEFLNTGSCPLQNLQS